MTHHSRRFDGLPLPASAQYRRGKSACFLRRSSWLWTENPLRAKSNYPQLQADLGCPVPLAKNIPLSPSGKSPLPARAIPSPKRGVRDRHERGMGCGGRGSVGRGRLVRRAVSVSEQQRAGRTALVSLSPKLRTAPGPASLPGQDGSRTAKPCGPDTRCWCQVGGGMSSPTGLCKPSIRGRR